MIECGRYGQESAETSCNVALIPRLEHSGGLVSDILRILDSVYSELVTANGPLAGCPGERDSADMRSIDAEKRYSCCRLVLLDVARRISGVSGIADLPRMLSCTVAMVRTVSAELHGENPACSRMMSGLSVQLGSIVLDSAALTGTRLDFGRSNAEAASVLERARMATEAKAEYKYGQYGTDRQPMPCLLGKK